MNSDDSLSSCPVDYQSFSPCLSTEPEFIPWSLSSPGDPPPRVSWIQERPLSFVGAWEPISFRRRAGYAYTDEAEFQREKEFSDAALEDYVRSGANALVIPFAKGFGLKATEHEIQDEKDLIARAHRKGLRIGTYIRVDALVPELVVSDCPYVYEWLSVGSHGRRGLYSTQQTFRKRICLLHPGATRWLEELCAYAILDLGADFLHLDGFNVSYFPWETCQCSRCLTAFRKWLKKRFTDLSKREQVFGLVDFDRIEFPDFEPGTPLPTVLSSPDMQAWYQFQWDKGMAFTRHVRRWVRQLNSETAISANPWWTRGVNQLRAFCQRTEEALPWFDAVWTEDSYHLDYVDGQIRSRTGMFKTAREYAIPVCHYHWSSNPSQIEASLALSIACNGGNPSCLGFSFRYLPHYSLGQEVKWHYATWAQQNWALVGNTKPAAEIALIRHHSSLAWNARAPWLSAMSLEQLLIRMKVPWRLFDQITFENLRQVRTILLPDAESLSDDEIKILHSWVRQGGRLFFTRKTGTHDEFRRRRPKNALLEWSGLLSIADTSENPAMNWFEWSKEDFTEFDLEEAKTTDLPPQIVDLGSGLLGYWPTIRVPFEGCVITKWIKAEHLKCPQQSDQIEAFIRQLHGAFSFEIQGPPSLLIECSLQPSTSETLIHLIQTDIQSAPIDVAIDRATGGWNKYRLLTPDVIAPTLSVEGTVLHCKNLHRYAIIAVTP